MRKSHNVTYDSECAARAAGNFTLRRGMCVDVPW